MQIYYNDIYPILIGFKDFYQMKKNILLLLFCLLLSSCYINKFNDYEVSQLPVAPPSLDSKMWLPITTSPIYINASLPYISYVSKKNIIYIYMNNKKQLIYLEHNPQDNTTKQKNISSVLSPAYNVLQITYTEYGSQKIIGLIENNASMNRFRSYFIHNNFSTELQYEFDIPNFKNDKVFLKFYTASKGTLMYTESFFTDKKFQIFNLNPSASPPSYSVSTMNPSGPAANEDPYLSLTRAKKPIAFYSSRAGFRTYKFDSDTDLVGPIRPTYTGLTFSHLEENDIWATLTDASGMNIIKVAVDDTGIITEETLKTDALGSKGIIAKGSDSSYFLASQNTANTIEISQTTDKFQTLESIGVANSGGIAPTEVNLLGLSGAIYLSYISASELTILKYSKKGDDLETPDVLPKAVITMESSTVTANVPFSVSAASSIGNNLTYFWHVSPNTGVIIDNPILSTTKITLPPSPSKVTITLEINDGVRSSSTTKEVTVS